MRFCHHCNSDIGHAERIGRRDACFKCGADLHCCLNCTFYDPAYDNQCRESQAERQVDKTIGNFCEYFSFHDGNRVKPKSDADSRARLDALFRKNTGGRNQQ